MNGAVNGAIGYKVEKTIGFENHSFIPRYILD
jgi:hypothetical protein